MPVKCARVLSSLQPVSSAKLTGCKVSFGSGGLARHVAPAVPSGQVLELPPVSGPVLVIAGSPTPMTAAQIDRLTEVASLTVVAALLTLVGYSMNDTIVTFDRIRENLKILRREALEPLVNRSVNQTLSRTVLTSGLTLLTALALFLFGGQVLNGFSFALVCGIIVGTYSSVFVASPILIFWHNFLEGRKGPASVPPSTPKPSASKPGSPKESVRRGTAKVK